MSWLSLFLFLSSLPDPCDSWLTPATTRLPFSPNNDQFTLQASPLAPVVEEKIHESNQLEELKEPSENKAFALQTPHSGRHFVPSHPYYRKKGIFRRLAWFFRKRRGRFTEGWYYRLTIPEQKASFAFIVSIEDPGLKWSDHNLCCMQVIGPDDEYIVQADRDDTLFWAWKKQQGLGCTFEFKEQAQENKYVTAMSISEWKKRVSSGFQILPTHFLGRIRGRDGTKGSVVDEDDGYFEPASCDFDFTVHPVCGWGDNDSSRQKSTAGWLASFAVFEPHWQVTMADGRATGEITWNNHTTYKFENALFYAEKNWGAALPSKWYWTQCNSFDGYEQLSVTAGGGVRKIPFGKESLGMVSVHYNGKFFEAVPWTGEMSWTVETWGSWKLKGSCTFGERPFYVEITYTCDPNQEPGLVFRAPTPDEGMVRFCRDTFVADCTLSLWELEWDPESNSFERKPGPPLIDQARSKQGGAEVGGGPWWDTWMGDSQVKQPFRSLLRLPYRFQQFRRRLSKRVGT